MMEHDANRQLTLDLTEIYRRLDDLESNPIVTLTGVLPPAGTQYNHLEDTGVIWDSVTDLTMADGASIGQAAGAQLTFDDSNNELDVSLNGAVDFIFKANEFSVEVGSFISATGIRATLAGNAAGLYVPWITGDVTSTMSVGTNNIANNQTALVVNSYSGISVVSQAQTNSSISAITQSATVTHAAVVGQSTTAARGVYGFSSSTGNGVVGKANAGRGGDFTATSGVGAYATSATGNGLIVDLTGAGTSVADFQDNGTSVLTIQDGGNVAIGNFTANELLCVGGDFGALGGTRISVLENGGTSGYNLGEDANNRGFIVWDSADDSISMGTVAASTIYGDTIVLRDGSVGIDIDTPTAKLHVDQDSATATIPVLTLDQADVNVVLAKIIATAAAASADRTLVAASDYTTPGALVGWIQIEIDDVGNRIADGDYYIPFYAIPTA